MPSLPTWREPRAQCPPPALSRESVLWSFLPRNGIDMRRLEPWRQELNHQQSEQISRPGDKEEQHITVSPLQMESGETCDAHTTYRPAEAPNSNDRADGAT